MNLSDSWYSIMLVSVNPNYKNNIFFPNSSSLDWRYVTGFGCICLGLEISASTSVQHSWSKLHLCEQNLKKKRQFEKFNSLWDGVLVALSNSQHVLSTFICTTTSIEFSKSIFDSTSSCRCLFFKCLTLNPTVLGWNQKYRLLNPSIILTRTNKT